MQNSLYKLYVFTCVLEVCVHIHPIMIKIHPVFFFFLNPYFKIPFLKSGCSEIPVRMTYSSEQATPTIVDWQGCFTLEPPWVSWELSAIVSTPVQGRQDVSD